MIVSKDLKTEEVGDEPSWIFKRHPQALVLVSPHRARAAQEVRDRDLFILDDGFQHLKIKKDLEIVLLDATQPKSDYYLLPVGRARNSFSEVTRADLVVITKVNLASRQEIETLKGLVRKKTKVPLHECSLTLRIVPESSDAREDRYSV